MDFPGPWSAPIASNTVCVNVGCQWEYINDESAQMAATLISEECDESRQERSVCMACGQH